MRTFCRCSGGPVPARQRGHAAPAAAPAPAPRREALRGVSVTPEAVLLPQGGHPSAAALAPFVAAMAAAALLVTWRTRSRGSSMEDWERSVGATVVRETMRAAPEAAPLERVRPAAPRPSAVATAAPALATPRPSAPTQDAVLYAFAPPQQPTVQQVPIAQPSGKLATSSSLRAEALEGELLAWADFDRRVRAVRRRRNSATELVRASDTAASAARRLARVGDEETAETDAVAYRERLVAELQALRPPPVPVAAPSPPETVEPPTPLAPLPPPPPLQEPPSAAEAVVEAVPSAVGPDAAGVAEAVPAVPAPPPAPPAALDWRAVQAQVQAQADADVQSALRRLFPKPDA